MRLQAPDGGATLSLHIAGSMPPKIGTILYFECARLDEDFARLEAAGIKFDHPPQDQAWLWREAHFADPDGNRLCLYHAGKNRLDPPWRVKT